MSQSLKLGLTTSWPTLSVGFATAAFAAGVAAAATAGFRDTCGLAYASFKREYLDYAHDVTRQFAVAPAASTGPRNVIVKNALPGGGADTLKAGFTITNPVPTLTASASR